MEEKKKMCLHNCSDDIIKMDWYLLSLTEDLNFPGSFMSRIGVLCICH